MAHSHGEVLVIIKTIYGEDSMFGSDVLDIAIGVIFLFLMLSLICSAISELLESWLKFRARDLEAGLRELFADAKADILVKQLYEHALINGLFRGSYSSTDKRRLPSYIPSRTFALALMDIVQPATSGAPSGAAGAVAVATPGTAGPGAPPTEQLRKSVAALPESKPRTAILALIDAAGNDATRARQNIEDWYNASMDRVSGWYKRRTQFILFALGLVLAGLSNADAIGFTQYLSTNKEARDLIVSNARTALTSPAPQKSPSSADSIAASTPPQLVNSLEWLQHEAGIPFGWHGAPSEPSKPTPPPAATSTPEQIATYRKQLDAYNIAEEAYNEHLRDYRQDWRRIPAGWEWLLKILGIVLTGCAVSFGAPFWFDVLNKFMIVRSTVKPAEKSPLEASKS